MTNTFVLTLTGTDRVGIVEEVTEILLKLGGNIETSRMARLGGEFAILMLVSAPRDQDLARDPSIGELAARGYKVTITPTREAPAQPHAGWRPYRIEVRGADHEGIIHQIAHTLSQHGINIETLDTGTAPAPHSGTPLFTMRALVLAPPALNEAAWQEALEDAGHRLHVDVTVSVVEPQPA